MLAPMESIEDRVRALARSRSIHPSISLPIRIVSASRARLSTTSFKYKSQCHRNYATEPKENAQSKPEFYVPFGQEDW